MRQPDPGRPLVSPAPRRPSYVARVCPRAGRALPRASRHRSPLLPAGYLSPARAVSMPAAAPAPALPLCYSPSLPALVLLRSRVSWPRGTMRCH
eukprot:2976892-Pleurochrysis_carterae.AAC.1